MRDSITLLEDDTRAVASLLGFVLLFGIAVIGFSMYQAEVVPDQNAQTEFQHFEEAKDQMVAFRSAAIDAGSFDTSRSTTFDLGTRFQQRYLAVNPAPPTGELTTSDQYEVTINPDSDDISVPARFLEFDPNYREFHPGVLRYEHGIVYLDAREANGGIVVLEGKSPLHLAPLQNEFSQTGQQRISLEVYSPEDTETFPAINKVVIPTQLPDPDNSQWNEELGLADADITYDGESNPNTITINGEDISEVTPVGIEERAKSANSTVKLGSSGDSGNGGNGGEGPELPSDAVAFDDQNGNGAYNTGEPIYSSQDIKNFDDTSVDLVIERDSIEEGKRKITASSVTVQSGVTVESTSNDLTIKSEDGDIDVSGATLSAGKEVELEAEGDINRQDTTINEGD